MTRYRLRLFGRWFFSMPLVFLLTGCPPRDDLVVTLEASPETIVLGESAELRWQIVEGTRPFELSLSPPVADELVSPLTVSPTVTTTYTLTVSDATGKSEVARATVTVVDDIGIDAFAAEVNGLEVTFTWTLIGETPIACTLDPGDGREVLELPNCTSPTTYRYGQAGNYDAQLTLISGVSATVNVRVPTPDSSEDNVGISGFVDEQSRNVVIILTDEGEQTISVDSLNRNIARVEASYGHTMSAAIRGLNAAVLGLLQEVPTSVTETPNLLDLSREFVVAVDADGSVLATSRLERETEARLEFNLTLPTEQDVALLIAEPNGLGGWVCKGSLEYQRVQNQRTVASEQVVYRFDNTVAGRDDLQAGAFAFNELTANLAARNDSSSSVPPSDEVQAATVPLDDAPDFQDGIYRFCENGNLAREDVLADLDWRSDIFNVSELPPETNPDLAAGEAAVYDFSVALLLEPQPDGSNRLVATSPLNENGNLRADVVRSAADNLDATLFFTDVAFFDASKRRFPLTPTYQFDARAQSSASQSSANQSVQTQALLPNVPDSETLDLGVIDGGLGYISGRVQTADGTPVAGANVIIVLDGERLAFNVAVSDENGFYELLIPSDTDNRYLLYAQNAPGTLAGIASNDDTGVRYVVGSSNIFDQDIILDVPIAAEPAPSANPPVVDAGPNRISNGGTVLLTGSATDADGDTLIVRWQVLTSPAGSNPRLSTPNSLSTQFNASVSGVYQLRLSAFDGARYAADVVTVTVSGATDNTPPIVNAGTDVVTAPNTAITLTGSTFDVDGDPLTVNWQVVSSPESSTPVFSGSESDVTQFRADVVGDYVLELSASDGQVTSSDTVTVQVREVITNNPPQVNAGEDTSTTVGTAITLEGIATDPDGDLLTFTWQVFNPPAGSNPVFGDPNAAITTFTADVAGSYQVQFSAFDGELTVSDVLTVEVTDTAINNPPQVNAGDDRDTTVGTAITLEGIATDADDDPLTFSWQIVSSPADSLPQFSDPSAATTTFSANTVGSYEVQFSASDGELTVSDVVIIQVTDTAPVNTPPVVNVGDDVLVETDESITLEGNATDLEDDPLTFRWEIVSSPAGSDPQLSAPNAATTDFSADLAGDYVLTLTASDGDLTASASLTVNVNDPPQVNAGDDISIKVGSSITLTGVAEDPENDSLTVTWDVISRPADSEPQLSNTTTAITTFTADVIGEYTLRLTASDGINPAEFDDVTVTVTAITPTWSVTQDNPLDTALGTDVPYNFSQAIRSSADYQSASAERVAEDNTTDLELKGDDLAGVVKAVSMVWSENSVANHFIDVVFDTPQGEGNACAYSVAIAPIETIDSNINTNDNLSEGELTLQGEVFEVTLFGDSNANGICEFDDIDDIEDTAIDEFTPDTGSINFTVTFSDATDNTDN